MSVPAKKNRVEKRNATYNKRAGLHVDTGKTTRRLLLNGLIVKRNGLNVGTVENRRVEKRNATYHYHLFIADIFGK